MVLCEYDLMSGEKENVDDKNLETRRTVLVSWVVRLLTNPEIFDAICTKWLTSFSGSGDISESIYRLSTTVCFSKINVSINKTVRIFDAPQLELHEKFFREDDKLVINLLRERWGMYFAAGYSEGSTNHRVESVINRDRLCARMFAYFLYIYRGPDPQFIPQDFEKLRDIIEKIILTIKQEKGIELPLCDMLMRYGILQIIYLRWNKQGEYLPSNVYEKALRFTPWRIAEAGDGDDN